MTQELTAGSSDSRSFFRVILPLFVVAHWGHHLIRAMLNPLLPYIRDYFNLTYAQSGLIVSAVTLTYSFSQLPSGRLADKYGPRIIITIAVAGSAVFGLLLGFSTSFAMVVVCLILLGLSGGGYHPSSVTMLSKLSGSARRGKIFGLHEIGGASSFFTAPLIAGALVAVIGWHNVYIVVSLIVLIVGIALHILLGRATSDTSFAPINRSTAPNANTLKSIKELAPFLTLNITIAILLNSVIYFIPLYLVDSFGVSGTTSSALQAVLYSAGLWASPLGGYLSDRFGRAEMVVLGTIPAGAVIYLLTRASYGFPLYFVLIGIGVCMFLNIPSGDSYIMSRISESNRGTILGIYYFGRAGSGIVSPIIGKMIDQFSFKPTFTIIALVMVIITISCSIPIWKTRRAPALEH